MIKLLIKAIKEYLELRKLHKVYTDDGIHFKTK